jgi:hypothetical protein
MRTMALTAWMSLGWAAGLGAAECEAVDENDLPRDCTLSEQLGECGYAAWDSWKECVDPDGDGRIDASFWERQYCDFFGAVDLLSCAVEVPWGLLKS